MLPETRTIETERLYLQEVNPSLYELIMDTYTNDEMKEFFGYGTDEEVRTEKLRYKLELYNNQNSYKRFILVRKDGNQAIGQCSFEKWFTRHYRAELSYDIRNNEEKNKGYMREAISHIVSYGFKEMNLNRIEAFVTPGNTPSLKVLERIGFTYEGLMREHHCADGKLHDTACYSLLTKDHFLLGRGQSPSQFTGAADAAH